MTSSTTKSTHPIISFYDPAIQARDTRNRTLTQILGWSDDKLEYYHDYIQILFPLPEGSPFNSLAPIIDRTTFLVFRDRSELQENLKMSLVRLLSFYGFKIDTNHTIVPNANFDQAARNWVRPFNHNHLRITRIIRSLRVLGLEDEADQFFVALKDTSERCGRISAKSMLFWERAAERSLYIAPEDDFDTGKGAEYLYEFEKKRLAGGAVQAHDG